MAQSPDTVLAIEHIVSTSGVMGGKPRIAGHRVSVENIVVLYEWHHWPVERIADQLELSPAQVHAALAYYFDHRQEIDESIHAAEELAKQTGKAIEELLSN